MVRHARCLRVRDIAQDQLRRQQAPQQALRVAEVVLAPAWRTVGLGLRQMQAEMRFQL